MAVSAYKNQVRPSMPPADTSPKYMMWLDDDKKTSLEEKVRRAVAYYQDKYGRSPSIALVSKQVLDGETAVDGIPVQASKTVLVHHILLGVLP